jgi:hypothetical protein
MAAPRRKRIRLDDDDFHELFANSDSEAYASDTDDASDVDEEVGTINMCN